MIMCCLLIGICLPAIVLLTTSFDVVIIEWLSFDGSLVIRIVVFPSEWERETFEEVVNDHARLSIEANKFFNFS